MVLESGDMSRRAEKVLRARRYDGIEDGEINSHDPKFPVEEQKTKSIQDIN